MKKLAFLLTPLFAYAIALTSAISVSAISDYDTVYQNTETIEVKRTIGANQCPATNITQTWSDYITVETLWQFGQDSWAPIYKASFLNSLNNGQWGVSQLTSQSGQVTDVYVYWTENQSLSLNWDVNQVYTSPNVYGVQITCAALFSGGNDQPTFFPLGWDGTQPTEITATVSTPPPVSTEDYWQNLFINTDEPSKNYPPGYEGQLIPSQQPSPPVQFDYVPNFEAVTGLDWKTDIRDTTFSTFDGILWTCSEDGNSIIDGDSGFAPVLYYQIWDDTTSTIIQDGFNNATAPIIFQAPKLNENKTYRIAGWYDCGGTVDFTDAANYEFSLTSNGMLGSQDFMQDCIVDGFPFIDISACVSNMGIIITSLSFGMFNFSNTWTPDQDCHYLVVLDDWINTPNIQICPQFPEYVRNVVSPFVTFLLGLITVRFISGRLGKY